MQSLGDFIVTLFGVLNLLSLIVLPSLVSYYRSKLETEQEQQANLRVELGYIRNELNAANRIIDDFIDE